MEGKISIDEFKKVEIKVGEILSAEKVPDTDKLLRLVVDFGLAPGGDKREERQVISGIAEFFPDLAQLVGKRCPFVTNLEYRTIRGLESQAMILATGGTPEEPFSLFETHASPGATAR